jgi:cyclophilin family peptidyl-prolyl cis-trans isomerase
MKVGFGGLTLSVALALALAWSNSAWSQEKDAKNEEAPTPAAKTDDKPAEKKAEKPAEPPPKPATAADFPAIYKKWTDIDKQLNELGEKYRFAPSSEERTVLLDRYKKLVAESEKLLPQLRSSAEAAFEAEPGKNPDVTKTVIGLMAYDYRRDELEAVRDRTQKLLAAKIEDPAIYSIAGMAAYFAEDFDTAEKYLPLADKAKKLDEEGQEHLKELPKTKELWAKEQAIRAKEKEKDDLPRVKLETNKGTIVVELFENEAPQTVGNFVSLVEAKKYDGTPFHRVLNGFMAQGGDPQGDGSGGPGYEIPCECYREEHRLHFRGTLSMAHIGKRDTAGSQFFLTFRRTEHLDGKHTVFGRVIEGMDILAKLQRRDPDKAQLGPLPEPDKILTATVLRKRDHEYVPTKVEPKPDPTKEFPGKKPPGKTPGEKSGKAASK